MADPTTEQLLEQLRATHQGFVLHLTITPDELDGGFMAEVVELPGCVSQGETVGEAIQNAGKALDEVLEVTPGVLVRPRLPVYVQAGEHRGCSCCPTDGGQ